MANNKKLKKKKKDEDAEDKGENAERIYSNGINEYNSNLLFF